MSVSEVVRDYSPVVGLAGVALTLWVNGRRAERDRRRDTHARALGAVAAYIEMPYAIRRRRGGPENASAERVRLSDDFRRVQQELVSCEALLRADPDTGVAYAFERLVKVLRATAGNEAKLAWNARPIDRDDEMGMPDLHERLAPIRTEQQRFERVAARSTGQWLSWTGHRKWLPDASTPSAPADRASASTDEL